MDRGRLLRILAISIAAVMIFARLGALPLRDPDEGRNSEVAHEMLANGSWLTPTYNGLNYLDKPAFFFDAVALSFSILGENELAARLPSALFACGILLIVYRFCRREYGEQTAALAVIVLATTPLFFALARHVIIDITLAFFVCTAVFVGYRAEMDRQRSRKWYALAAASAGFATLVKGPVGFLVPLLTLGTFNIAQKNIGWWKRMFHPLNFLIVGAVVGPWFYALTAAHPDFARYGLMEESLNRFATKSFSRTAPFYYYGLVVLGGLFAWSMLLPGAIKSAWQARDRWSPADRLLIIWAVVVVIFFSISKSKLPHYILSALIALAILTARLFSFALANRAGAAARIIHNGLLATASVISVVIAFLVVNLAFPDWAAGVFKIHRVEFDRVALAFGPAIVILGIVAALAVFARRWRSASLAFCAFLALPFLLITVGFAGIQRYSEASSSRELAKRLDELPDDTVIAGLQSFAPGLPFYTQEPVTLITDSGHELSNYIAYELARSTNWPAHIVRFSEREEWLKRQTNDVCLIAKGGALPELRRMAAERNLKVSELVPGWSHVLIPAAESPYSTSVHRRDPSSTAHRHRMMRQHLGYLHSPKN